jgi:hypothetical protein
MARPTLPVKAAVSSELVSGNRPASMAAPAALSASTAIYPNNRRLDNRSDRHALAQPWQVECYRQVNICGEARYAVTLFAHMAARAEIGISEGNSLGRKAVWVNNGPEVDVLAELVPTVRERKKIIRDFMTHWVIAGECYLIARTRQPTDPDPTNPLPIWEIVGVLALRKMGDGRWQVKHDNDNYIDLADDDPVIRLWNPDPENPREAWSPMRSLLPTLKEIEWLTGHIFTQVRSRLMSAGVWFLPENLTFTPPSPEGIEGGEETIAQMNEAEQFMASLAQSAMSLLDADEVSFPTVVMAEAAALSAIEQNKLIKFWAEIDDKAMHLRSDAVRRFALGFDLPPEQVLGASGLAVTGAGGSAGSVNHWGVWANEEQTISAHIEPALDNFVGVLTVAVVRLAVPGSTKVVGYDTATLRLRQDRSKEAMEWYDRGLLKGDVALRENGFDPENDMMDDAEFRRWLLVKIAGGSATPEQVQESLRLLGVVLDTPMLPAGTPAPGQPGRNLPPSLEDHPYEGPPREQHDHSPAPFTALHASAEALVLRALEKAGNRLLNDGKRGRDRDRTTPPHLAHLTASVGSVIEPSMFDFSMLSTVLGDQPAARQARIGGALARFCVQMYRDGTAYTRDGLIDAMKGL